MEKFEVKGIRDIEAIEQVPLKQRMQGSSTYAILEAGAAIDPNAIAISFLMNGDAYESPQRITHGQFIGRVRQTANLLFELGVRKDDVVSYLLPNIPQTHFTLWGAEAAGIANPINPMLEPDTIKDILLAAGTKVLVALGDFPGSDIWPKVEAIRKEIPTLKAVIRVMGPSNEAEGIIGYEQVIDKYPADRLVSGRKIDGDDVASLYHTGGTTGRPKLARRTHLNEVVLALQLQATTSLAPGETVMVGLPLFHCNGTCVTGLLPFSIGGEVVMLSPKGYRDLSIIKNFYKIVERYKPVFFSCVPTVLSMLLDVPTGDADIGSLRYVVCGAAPLSVELFNRFESKTGIKIIEGYGMTESACASAVNPKDGERRVGSIGLRLPYQQMKVAILDEEGKFVRDAKPDEIGVVLLKGPTVFKGYVEEIHNQGIWVGDGWFNTGDMGRIDQDQYFWLTGRRKELIIRGGHNIDPALIEEPIYRHPEVKTCAAVPLPDAYAGEVPVVYVELIEGSKATADDIMKWAKEKIGERAAVPKEIVIINQIPLTAVGKIFKPALKYDAVRRAYGKELEKIMDLADQVEVTAAEDKTHGIVATIKIKAKPGVDHQKIKARVAELLANYIVRQKVEVE